MPELAAPLLHPLPKKEAQSVPSYSPILGVPISPVILKFISFPVATNEYHTSAAGPGISFPSSHAAREEYGFSAVAPILERQNTSCTEVVIPQTGRLDNPPKLQAEAQSSGTAGVQVGVVPVQAPGVAQLIVACQPISVTEPSEVNPKVRQPLALVAVTMPGEIVPSNVPIGGATLLLPSYMVKKSKLASVSKTVKLTVTTSPGVEGQKVVVTFSALA